MTRPALAAACLRLSQGVFLFVVGLLPLVLAPWTSDALEPNKQLLLVIGVALALVTYLTSLVLAKHSLGRPNILSLALVALLIVTGLSAKASLMPASSWLEVLSLVTLMSLFFLAQALDRQPSFRSTLLIVLFTSATVLGLWELPAFFGARVGPFSHLLGTPHATAIYLLVSTTFGLGLWLNETKRAVQVAALVTAFMTFLMLLALDSGVLWALALVGSGSLLLVAVWQAEAFQGSLKLAPAMVLAVLSLVFLVFPSPLHSPFPQEVSPNLKTTLSVVTGAWNEGSVALGTGPGTFQLVYAKYAPLGVNRSDFWELIFDRGDSAVSTALATVGVGGVLAWLLFVLLLAAGAAKKLLKAETDWRSLPAVLAAWLVLVVAAFVYPQNLSLAGLFWVLSGVLAGRCFAVSETKASRAAQARLATMLVTVFAGAGLAIAVVVMLPRYQAEIAFARAVKLNTKVQSSADIDHVIQLLDKAAAANPDNDVYVRNLAGALLQRLANLSPEELADDAYVQSLIMTTIATATKATEISPANVLNWEVRGLVYRELLSVVPDAAAPAIQAYEQAVLLAPINPKYRVEAAKSYMAWADAQTPLTQNDDIGIANEARATQDQALSKTEEHLTTAIALKGDYAPAHYYLALLRQRQGNLAEAVRGLERVRAQAPGDVGVGLQLGLLYLRQGKNELAKAELERILVIAPAYANAHWYLSVVYEQTGDLEKAIQEVEKVLDTNPDNVTVKTRLDRLKAGETSEVIPEPVVEVAE